MAHWARALASLDNPFAWPGSSRRRRSARDRKFSRPRARPASSRSASATTWMRSPFSSASPTSAITAAAPRRSKRRWSSSYSAIRRTRRRRRSRSSCQRTSTRPTGSTATSSSGGDPRADLQAAAATPGVAHYLIHSYDYPPIAHQARRGAASTAGSRLTRRMLFTCLRTSSPGSGRGKSPLNRTASRRACAPKPRAARTQPADCTTCCTRWITWSTPISSSARTGRRARSSTR